MKNFTHPELQNNEVFFTNSDLAHYEKMKWGTKRKGRVAYDGMGQELNIDDWFPVFVDSNELESSNTSLRIAREEFRKQHSRKSLV